MFSFTGFLALCLWNFFCLIVKKENGGVLDLGKGKFDTLGYKEVSFQPLEYSFWSRFALKGPIPVSLSLYFVDRREMWSG